MHMYECKRKPSSANSRGLELLDQVERVPD